MNRNLAAAGVAVVIAGGGVAASLSVAGAQTNSTSPTTTAPVNRPNRGARLKITLDPLVTNGTINQSQEDKVISALEGASFSGARHRLGTGRHLDLTVVAKTLGLTTQQLRTDLLGGKTIASIAANQKISTSTVIQALVQAQNSRIDAAVNAGTFTEAQANTIKSNELQRITAQINGTVGPIGAGEHRHWRSGTASGSTTTVQPSTTTTTS